jgi:hypothetical protein
MFTTCLTERLPLYLIQLKLFDCVDIYIFSDRFRLLGLNLPKQV